MDYLALKAALAGLPDDPGEAAAALATQTAAVEVDIPTADARSVLLLSGEWFRIKQLAKMTPSKDTPIELIAAADICVDTLTLTTTLHTSQLDQWATMQAMCGGLIQAGVLSRASLDAWAAMRVRTVPVWPDVTAGDVQTARAQP